MKQAADKKIQIDREAKREQERKQRQERSLNSNLPGTDQTTAEFLKGKATAIAKNAANKELFNDE